jgi:hypothetical protein
MTIRTASRIAEFADDWRATLTHRSICTIPEWLTTDEEGGAGPTRYLLRGADGSGTALIAQRVAAGTFPTNDPIALLLSSELDSSGDPAARANIEAHRARLTTRLEQCYPVATVTLPGGYLPGVVGERRPDAVAALLDGLDKAAAEWDCPITALPHVPDGDPLAAILTSRGYLGSAVLAQAELTLNWPDFDAYVAALPKRRRNKIRRERREFTDAGLVVREDTIGTRGAEMAELHAAQLRGYGHHTVTAERLRGLMDGIDRHLAPWCRILVAERDGQLEGFALSYEYGSELHLKMTGFSAYAQDHFGYFNMTYYSVIEDALRRGLQTVFFGPLSYRAKVVRGCHLAPRSTYVRVPAELHDEMAELAGLINRYNRAVFAEMGKGER